MIFQAEEALQTHACSKPSRLCMASERSCSRKQSDCVRREDTSYLMSSSIFLTKYISARINLSLTSKSLKSWWQHASSNFKPTWYSSKPNWVKKGNLRQMTKFASLSRSTLWCRISSMNTRVRLWSCTAKSMPTASIESMAKWWFKSLSSAKMRGLASLRHRLASWLSRLSRWGKHWRRGSRLMACRNCKRSGIGTWPSLRCTLVGLVLL